LKIAKEREVSDFADIFIEEVQSAHIYCEQDRIERVTAVLTLVVVSESSWGRQQPMRILTICHRQA